MLMKRKVERGVWQTALLSMSLGWDLALPIFAGVLAGHFLDRKLGTGYVFTVGLLLFGIFAGFYNMMRTARRVEEKQRHYSKKESRDEE